ncbi:MAG: IS5 family transposase [Ghiorsea sp.]|nr:IS5 family transposase [Ghiorsea sp.]
MSQLSFSEMEYSNKKRMTRRERFLERMDKLIPWSALESKLSVRYPKRGNGRPPYALGVMLRVHCMQLFYNLSDPMMEDSLYEIDSMRRFAGLKLSKPIPDETTILNFRRFLEKHGFGELIFAEINAHLQAQGLSLSKGTIVDASIISAPTSVKNKTKKRDPEMHQTKKGNQWHFGMKLHIGVDSHTGLVHSAVCTAANAHDVTQAGELLHGEEGSVHADAGYVGVGKRKEHQGREVGWKIAARPSKRKMMPKCTKQLAMEKEKSSVRAKVEHPFYWVKCFFGYSKVRYRGLDKNKNRLYMLLGFTNLLRSQKLLSTG